MTHPSSDVYGPSFATTVARRLATGPVFWRGGAMGSRSDGFIKDSLTGHFYYAVIEEGSLLSVIEDFAGETEFAMWLADQSDDSFYRSAMKIAGHASFINRSSIQAYLDEDHSIEGFLASLGLSNEPFGVELAKAIASQLRFESYPSAKSRFELRDGFARASEGRDYAYGAIEMGRSVATHLRFDNENAFVDWLARQSDLSLMRLSFEAWKTPSMIQAIGLNEFATTPLNLRKPNLE